MHRNFGMNEDNNTRPLFIFPQNLSHWLTLNTQRMRCLCFSALSYFRTLEVDSAFSHVAMRLKGAHKISKSTVRRVFFVCLFFYHSASRWPLKWCARVIRRGLPHKGIASNYVWGNCCCFSVFIKKKKEGIHQSGASREKKRQGPALPLIGTVSVRLGL